MKRIGIDISMLVYQGSGVANYTYNIVKQLVLYDKKNEYRLFYSSLRRPKNFYYLDEFRKLGAKVYDYPFPPRLLALWWNTWHIIPVEWFIGKVDWYFSSDFLRPPLLKGTKGITTIHDFTWKIFPQYHTQEIVDAHRKKLDLTINNRDIIITDSQNTKEDLIRYYPQSLKHNPIHVIYPSVNDSFRPIKDQKQITKILYKYHIQYPNNYLLYVGAIEPRKNLETAIKVFAELIQDKKYAHFEFIIAGRAGWKNENIYALIKKLKLKNKINTTGFIEDFDLPYLYNSAKVCIYLSEYEGFGLPPVEAARCGKFTLLYSTSSLKELFTPSYPYTKKGAELQTLKALIETKNSVKQYIHDFAWKKSVSKFISLLE